MSDQTHPPSRLDAISTRWTELRRAHLGTATLAGEARKTLVLRYQPAIRRYIRALVQDEQDAEDLTQDVLVRLLAGDFAGAREAYQTVLAIAERLAAEDPTNARWQHDLSVTFTKILLLHTGRQTPPRKIVVHGASIAVTAIGVGMALWNSWLWLVGGPLLLCYLFILVGNFSPRLKQALRRWFARLLAEL